MKNPTLKKTLWKLCLTRFFARTRRQIFRILKTPSHAYRHLNELYPHTPEFQERLLNFTRSFGQRNREFSGEAANIAHAQAEFTPSSAEFRTRSGELQAEPGNYNIARNEWEKLIETAEGEPEIYLETATVYWDYFQYEDALRTIKNLREKDRRQYALRFSNRRDFGGAT